MPLGGYAPLPLRLGGSSTDGWVAPQHARVAADLVVLQRVMPFVTWTYSVAAGTVTVESYFSQEGNGANYIFDTATNLGVGQCDFLWNTMGFADDYGIIAAFAVQHAVAVPHVAGGSPVYIATVDLRDDGVRIDTQTTAGAAADPRVTVSLW